MDIFISIIIKQPVNDPLCLFVFLIVYILPNRSGCGRDVDQWLVPGRNAVRNDVIQLASVLPLMHLIHQATMNIQAVQGIAVRCQGLECAVIKQLAGKLCHQRFYSFEQSA